MAQDERIVDIDAKGLDSSGEPADASIYRSFFENAREGMALVDAEGRVSSWNGALAALSGIRAPEAIGRDAVSIASSLVDLERHGAEIERIRSTLASMIDSGEAMGKSAPFRLAVLDKASKPRDLELIFFPVRVAGNIWAGALVRDISATLAGERFLERALESRNLLLRELVHRIKNNIAMVASLLSFSRREMETERDAAIVEEARNRLLAVSLLYENMQGSGDVENLLLDAYLEKLVHAVERSSGNAPIEFVSQPIVVPQKSALSVGLITNELLTNAMKYAWRNHPFGMLRLSTSRADGRVRVVVEDDGSGLKPGWKPGVGLTIAGALAEQLGSALLHEERKGGGTRASFDFPI